MNMFHLFILSLFYLFQNNNQIYLIKKPLLKIKKKRVKVVI